jgi:uncharacterized protein YndB with AHSA1/START domain
MNVRSEITVDAPPERAFEVFTGSFDAWWPRAHKIGQGDMLEAILEPRTGGRWYERDADGGECEWGTVLAYEPPRRLVLTWQIGGDWRYHADQASEVEVTFTPHGEKTLVQLEHRHIERHGDTAEQVRAAVSREGGWPGLLQLYRGEVESSSRAAELMQ